jgi:hypothetical protein
MSQIIKHKIYVGDFKMIKYLFVLFIGFLPLQIFAANPDYYQKNEDYKDYPPYVKDSYSAAFYVITNYDELSKKDGYLTPLPIISQEEIEKIRNGNNQDNLNYGVFSK